MFANLILKFLRSRGYDLVKSRHTVGGRPVIVKPIDPIGVELLGDRDFQESCAQVYNLTLLDTPRLANLWQLCRQTDPQGNILEVGVYQGGSALHLANSSPGRQVFACDSFTGFARLDKTLDHAFDEQMFKNTSKEAVERMFSASGRPIRVIAGFFPQSCAAVDLGRLSFVHLDVDVFEATLDALNYVSGKMMDRSLIVLDDYNRTADGVNRAIDSFLTKNSGWQVLPLFPSQALLIPKTWFHDSASSHQSTV